jgi:hypothetical protein
LSFDPNAIPDKHSRNKLRKKRGDDLDSDLSESRSKLDKKLEKERAKEEKERIKKERKLKKDGYDTDDGSIKLKKSRSFFRLSNKSSSSTSKSSTLPELPIAGKFSTTIPSFDSDSPPATISRKPTLTISPPPISPYVVVSSSDALPLDSLAHENHSSDVVPSTDFIVPSPSVLAHYDLPPPSPPPTGPLPRLPITQQPFLRKPSPSRLTPLSNSITAEEGAQQRSRGRQVPFPMRPPPSGAVGPGLESQLRVPRYRDLYVIGSPGGGWKSSSPAPRIWEDGQKWVNDHPEEPSQQEVEDDDDLRDVLDRFIDEEEPAQHDKALPTRHSYRGAAALVDSDESVYAGEDDDERTTTYLTEGDGDLRISRHSEESGRFSILDDERSEEVRARFLRRVEAMIDSENERGRERARRREPPVPKIPDGLAKGPSSHIRF